MALLWHAHIPLERGGAYVGGWLQLGASWELGGEGGGSRRTKMNQQWLMEDSNSALSQFTSQYGKRSKMGKVERFTVGLAIEYPTAEKCYEVFLFSFPQLKKIPICDFLELELEAWDFEWSYKKLWFLSWNLSFRSQYFSIALLIIYILGWNIYIFLDC